MPLSPGLRIGPYEIVGAIGAGGMGEVYRARDTKLGRDVAIKALPDAVGADADRITRFQREAQLLASLNHPHIATIHGLADAEGATFIVLELVDGESLAQRVKTGPVPVPEALAIARQIADALQAAHLKGIVHRDLKPANVMLTADGRVKVLDFGLAKAMGADPGSGTKDSPSTTPTTTSPPTHFGMVIGTAAYMAPEQAKGRTVDKRADVWAFGCVVYEMLTATRPFAGEDITDTIAAVMRGDPDWSLLPAGLPPVFERYLRRCFEKNANDRVQDIGDVRLALDGAFDVPVVASPVAAASRWTTGRVAVAALALASVAAAAAWLLKPAPQAPPAAVRRFTVTPSPAMLTANTNRDIAVTPDGSAVVYIAGVGLGRQVYVWRFDALAAVALRPAERFFEPVISADSRWVAFNDETDYTLRKMPLSGGPVVTITKIGREMLGATWGADDTIVYATTEGLWRVSAGGGTPVSLAKPDAAKGEVSFGWPEYLPGQKAVLFAIRAGGGRPEDVTIAALDLGTGVSKVLVHGGTNPRYTPSGHLLYVTDGSLRAVAFSADTLEVHGDPIPIADGLKGKASGAENVAVAADGTLVYVTATAASIERRLAWIDRTGARQALNAPLRGYGSVRISPDGTRLAAEMHDQQNDIFIWDLARETLARFTTDQAFDGQPVWTRDSRRIVFSSSRLGAVNLFLQPADGAGEPRRLFESTQADNPSSVTPDGARVIFRRDGGTGGALTGQDIMSAPLDGTSAASPVLATKANERNGEVSPDGKWLAYESNESGVLEVYVRPFPDVQAGRWQLTFGGGKHPAWNPAGHELFYAAVDGRIMSVQIAPGPTFTAAPPKVAINSPVMAPYTTRSYDVSPDGKRFLIVEPTGSGESSSPSITVVLNWAGAAREK